MVLKAWFTTTVNSNGHLTLTYQQDLSAGGVVAEAQTSTDLTNWTGVAVELVGTQNNGDGTITVTYRGVSPDPSTPALFMRLRVSQAP